MQTYPEIVAVGHLCMDKLHICERMPQDNTSAHILSYTQQPGGTACQAAVAACRLGATAGYLSPLGDDEVGRSLYEGCVEEGLDMSLCRVDPGVVTHFTNVIVNAQRNTRTFLSYHGKFAPINFGEAERDYISHAKILHLDNTRNDNALAAARIAKEHHVLVSLDGSSTDPDIRRNWELAELADVVIAGEKFPWKLTGIEDRRAAMLEVGKRLHAKIFLMTVGGSGCILYSNGTLIDYPAYKIAPVDTTGAGDAFHGAFLFGLLHGFDLDYNIRFSSAVGALSCMAVGGRAGLPDHAQTLRFMQEHPFG